MMKRALAFVAALAAVFALTAHAYRPGGLAGHGNRTVLGSWDFTTHASGFASSPGAGLSFSRASGSADTVQTGTSTVAVGTSNDYPRFGRRLDADSIGLVIEETRTNLWLLSRTISVGTGLAAGSLATYTTGQTSPDGTTNATRVQIASGGYSNFFTAAGTTGTLIATEWAAAGSGSGVYQLVNANTTTLGTATPGTASASYARVAAGPFTYTAASANVLPSDGRDFTPVGGAAAGARDCLVDLIQLETGSFATEAIVTAGSTATRAGERLYLASAAPYVSAGRLAVAVSLRPKAAPASYSAAFRVWTRGTDYVEIATTGVMTVSIGGSTNTTAALSWAANDSLDLYVAAGGSTATVVSYRVNGGATSHPTITGSALGSVSTGGALDLFCNGTSSQWSAWITNLTFWKGAKPTWARNAPANDNAAQAVAAA